MCTCRTRRARRRTFWAVWVFSRQATSAVQHIRSIRARASLLTFSSRSLSFSDNWCIFDILRKLLTFSAVTNNALRSVQLLTLKAFIAVHVLECVWKQVRAGRRGSALVADLRGGSERPPLLPSSEPSAAREHRRRPRCAARALLSLSLTASHLHSPCILDWYSVYEFSPSSSTAITFMHSFFKSSFVIKRWVFCSFSNQDSFTTVSRSHSLLILPFLFSTGFIGPVRFDSELHFETRPQNHVPSFLIIVNNFISRAILKSLSICCCTRS